MVNFLRLPKFPNRLKYDGLNFRMGIGGSPVNILTSDRSYVATSMLIWCHRNVFGFIMLKKGPTNTWRTNVLVSLMVNCACVN